MTACRSSGRRLLAGAGLLASLALAGAGATLAQTRGPILLGPPAPLAPGAPDAAPSAPALAPPAVVPRAPEPAAPRTTADGAIRIEGLTRLTADAAGPLGADGAGLRSDLWSGTPGPVALRLVALLPAGPDSRALRQLQRRLLLTAGPAPADLPSEGVLLTARADRLLAMGALDELAALAAVIPGRDDDPDLARPMVARALALGEDENACRRHEAVAARADDHYWVKVGVVCDLWRGNVAKAEFGARLLGEIGEPDTLLQELVQAKIAGHSGGAMRLAGAEPVHLAAARIAGVSIDPDVDAIESLPVLVALARGIGEVSFAARLAAAERAERAGALATDALIALYTEVAVQSGPVEGALRAAEADPSAHARALLWRTADANAEPATRARVIGKALEIAEDAPAWRQTARVFAPLIRRLDIGPATDAIAADAIRALVAAGEAAAARPWMEWLRTRAAGGDSRSVVAARKVWPVALIGGGDLLTPYDEESVAAWWAELRESEPDEASDLGAAALTLMEALGAPIGLDAWRGLAGAPPTSPYEVPTAAYRNGIAAGAAAGRLAETVALACAAFGDVPLDAIDPTAVAGTVAALRRIGLEDDARLLAGEAAVAYGL